MGIIHDHSKHVTRHTADFFLNLYSYLSVTQPANIYFFLTFQ